MSGTRGGAIILPGTEAMPPGAEGNLPVHPPDQGPACTEAGVGGALKHLLCMRTWSHMGVCHQVAAGFGRREG